MNVSLTPNLEKYINQKLEEGLYSSASEIVREGLRLLIDQDMHHQEKIRELNKQINLGLTQLSHGEGLSGKDVFHEIRVKNKKLKDSSTYD